MADDHELFRAALAEVFQREFGFRSVIEAASLDEAIDHLGRTADIAFASIDLAMPGMDGASSLHAIREVYPHVQVAVITASERREDILQALSAGAHGYIPKTFRTGEIAAAVRTILEGKIFIPLCVAKAAGPESPKPIASPPVATPMPNSKAPPPGLSPRQKQVLDLMALGNSNKQIARLLHLAEGTVKVHVAALYRALGAHNRVGAVTARTQQLTATSDDLPYGV